MSKKSVTPSVSIPVTTEFMEHLQNVVGIDLNDDRDPEVIHAERVAIAEKKLAEILDGEKDGM